MTEQNKQSQQKEESLEELLESFPTEQQIEDLFTAHKNGTLLEYLKKNNPE